MEPAPRTPPPRAADATLVQLLLTRQYATLDEFEAAARARLGVPDATALSRESR